MKKIISFLSIILMVLLMVGCGVSDKQVVGTYNFEQGTMESSYGKQEIAKTAYDYFTLTLNEDGTSQIRYKVVNSYEVSQQNTWTKSGSKISIITVNGTDAVTEVFTYKNSKLTSAQTYTEDGETVTIKMVFKKR